MVNMTHTNVILWKSDDTIDNVVCRHVEKCDRRGNRDVIKMSNFHPQSRHGS